MIFPNKTLKGQVIKNQCLQCHLQITDRVLIYVIIKFIFNYCSNTVTVIV